MEAVLHPLLPGYLLDFPINLMDCHFRIVLKNCPILSLAPLPAAALGRREGLGESSSLRQTCKIRHDARFIQDYTGGFPALLNASLHCSNFLAIYTP
jgi:hypothetical protein